jgi:CubicO group peptidase (beta-lactamase class C family)
MGAMGRAPEETEAIIVRLMEQAHVPGLAIATVQGDTVDWHGEFGVRDAVTLAPVTADTPFQAASLSKPVFAYAVLKLVECGLLDLDRPLSAYVDEPFAPDDPLLDQVTARQVLCHTTGWPNWRPRGQPLRREHPPGERFGYSGEGYIYLQRAVEHLTGQSLAAFMQQALLVPLNLGHSQYAWSAEDDPAVATSHDDQGKPHPRYVGTSEEAATSLHTTATDFARFLAASFTPGTQPWQLGASLLAEMFHPQIAVGDRVAWGLGWGLEETPEGRAIWHWGDNSGYKNFTVAYPDSQRGIVILTNGNGGSRIWRPLVRLVLGGTHPAFAWLAARYGYSTEGDEEDAVGA